MINPSEHSNTRKKLYFSNKLSDTVKELDRRSSDKELSEKLAGYYENHKMNFTDLSLGGPYAVLSRSIASPNLEQLRFLHLAKKYNLKPVILEYDGKLVTKNMEKFCLCKMHFFTDKNNREYKVPFKMDIADTNYYQGKNMSDILTYQKKSLSDFHHNLLWRYANCKTCSLYDFTQWFNKARVMEEYYFYFLLTFIKNAILFDNYLLSDKHEGEFIEQKILPSVEKIEKIFGIKPLICPLVPFKNEVSPKWLSYKQEIEEMVKNNF